MLASIGVSVLAWAQTPAPSFEIASLKPVQSTGGSYLSNLGTTRHGEVKLTNTTLSDCIRYAYSIITNDAQIATSDKSLDWIRNREVRFDIAAKAGLEAPPSQLLVMLQTLLTERFKMALHRESRELPYLALTIGKNGPKITSPQESAPWSGMPQIPGRIISDRMSMSTLATLLSRFLRQTVLDQTGLAGPYGINLVWTPENFRTRPDTTESDASGPTIYTAVQEQLGLKLESRKGPVEVIVIDHAEKVPVEN